MAPLISVAERYENLIICETTTLKRFLDFDQFPIQYNVILRLRTQSTANTAMPEVRFPSTFIHGVGGAGTPNKMCRYFPQGPYTLIWPHGNPSPFLVSQTCANTQWTDYLMPSQVSSQNCAPAIEATLYSQRPGLLPST